MSVWPAAHAFGSHRVPQRDLIANGAATMILNLGEAGALQFGEFCHFLQLAKQSEFAAGASGGGLGIGSAVEASLNSLTGEDGYITNDNLVHYLHAVAESAGQPLSQSDIDDVLALSDDGNGNGNGNFDRYHF